MTSEDIIRGYYVRGYAGSQWYASELAAIGRLVPDAPRMISFLASTSANSTVRANVTLAIKAERQHTDGEPFTGYLGQVVANLERGARGEPLHGLKIEPFRRALLGDPDAVVIDRWIFRAYGTKDRDAIATSIRCLASGLNVAPSAFQAGVWCGIKLEVEGSRADIAPFSAILADKLAQLPLDLP